jgi:hypothetical protein
MGLFAFAWIVGEGLIVWRWAKHGAPPTPGALLLPSMFYLGLAVLAEYEPARTAATGLAWGLDIAVLLQVVGKDPGQATGWPPLMINNPDMLLPGGTSVSSTGTSTGAAAQGPTPPAGVQTA